MATGYTTQVTSGIYQKATINLVNFTNNSEDSTLTVEVSNFEPAGIVARVGGSGDLPIGYPILLEVGELSEEHDELMPRATNSSIVISNKPESLGFQRKFSDLLEYYSINEQDITIEFFYVNGLNSNGSFVGDLEILTTWKLKGDSVSVDFERETVTINLKSGVLTDKVITKQITASEFTDAPTSSVGKYLPIALGASVPVLGTKINSTDYALTTTIGTTYPINSVIQYYAQHPQGEYRLVTGTASTSTNLVTSGLSTLNATRTLGAGIAFPLRVHSDYLLHRMTVQFTGTSTASATGVITLQVVESKIPINASQLGTFRSDADFTVLGSASIDKANHTASIAGTGDFSPTFDFDAPVLITPSSREKTVNTSFTYFYVIIKDSNPAKPVSIKMYNNPSSGSFGYEMSFANDVWSDVTLYNQAIHTATGITFTLTDSSTADDNGLGYSKIALGTLSTCSLERLNMGAIVDGLELSGTTAGYLHQILQFFYSSSEFDSSDIFSTFANVLVGATYERTISGATVGRTTRLQLTRELLRNAGARLISLTSSGETKVGLYYWGSALSSQGTIDDRSCFTTKYGSGSRSSIVNNVTVSYAKNILETTDRALLEQGASAGYSQILANQRLSGSDSITLYGSNDLTNANFPFIREDTSMSNVVNYYLRKYEHPYKFVEFYVPFIPSFGYPDANELPVDALCSEVIELVTAKMPAFYGTSVRPLLAPSEDIEEVTETSGFDFIRAKRYRLQIQSKSIRFQDGIPVLYFVCEILDNHNNPT